MSNYTRVQHIWNFTNTNSNRKQKPNRIQQVSSEHGQPTHMFFVKQTNTCLIPLEKLNICQIQQLKIY
jgi:hypothetical protein